jgi:adenosylhomocysteine nucleosidase
VTAPVLFIAAEPRECANWVNRWTDVRTLNLPVHWARTGNWQGRPMIAIANGAGWARARGAVLSAPPVHAIYSLGYCGGLDPALRIGDIFVATEVRSPEGVFPALLPKGPGAQTGPLASISHIAQTAREKFQIRQTGALAVEMEAAAVADASKTLGVAFHCVRVVSDLANEDFANNLNSFLMENGKMNIPRLLLGALGSPAVRFGELIRLSRRAALASNNLGEFLALCSY